MGVAKLGTKLSEWRHHVSEYYPNPRVAVMFWFMQVHRFFDMESWIRLELSVGIISSSPSTMNELGLLLLFSGISRAIACDITLFPLATTVPSYDSYPDIF